LFHNPVHHERTTRIHSIRERREEGEINIVCVTTTHQFADVLTGFSLTPQFLFTQILGSPFLFLTNSYFKFPTYLSFEGGGGVKIYYASPSNGHRLYYLPINKLSSTLLTHLLLYSKSLCSLTCIYLLLILHRERYFYKKKGNTINISLSN
jgi:hypothetical protein